jgi:hypothetical protein
MECFVVMTHDRVLFFRGEADTAGQAERSLAGVQQDGHHVRGDVAGDLLGYGLGQRVRVEVERFLGERPLQADEEPAQGSVLAIL